MGVQHEHRAKQHACQHECDDSRGKPSRGESAADEGSVWLRLIAVQRVRQESCLRTGLPRSGLIHVFDFRDETIALTRNRFHEGRLLRRITQDLSHLVHGGVDVCVVVDKRIRRP